MTKLLTRRQFLKGGKEGPALPLALVGIGIGVMGLGSPAPSQDGTVGISDLPNGTLLLDKSVETQVNIYFGITDQNVDLTTDTSFNAGEQLLCVAEIGLDGNTNELNEVLVRPFVEGVQGHATIIRFPATGAGDTPVNLALVLSQFRTLASGGTKLFRLTVTSSNLGNATFVIWNRRIYRVKNASS